MSRPDKLRIAQIVVEMSNAHVIHSQIERLGEWIPHSQRPIAPNLPETSISCSLIKSCDECYICFAVRIDVPNRGDDFLAIIKNAVPKEDIPLVRDERLALTP